MDQFQAVPDKSSAKRKTDHLKIALNEDVQFKEVPAGFEKYYFIHRALPEINLSDVDLSVSLFGKRLAAPLVISSMVGGIEEASTINRNLAQAAQTLGLAMGVGSQRCLIEPRGKLKTYQVRDVAPDILLFANLGAVQLNYGFGVKECLGLVKAIGADALILHLNPLQEAVQPEGNTNFAGLLEKIALVCREFPVPVLIKEVGAGISEEVAAQLAQAGAAGIEVAGAGGTCWSEIERKRTSDKQSNEIAAAFSTWGIPTSESILMARQGAPGLPIIASGGIRTGLDVAKAIALGSEAAGIALPLLKPALNSALEAQEALNTIIETLRIALFCTGSSTIADLKNPALLRKLGDEL